MVMILVMIMMIIDEMICVERTKKKILSNDDDDDHKDDDDFQLLSFPFFPQMRIFAITSQVVHTVDVLLRLNRDL